MANSIRARRLLKPFATRLDIRLQPTYVLPNHEISLAKLGGIHIRYSSNQALRFIFEPAKIDRRLNGKYPYIDIDPFSAISTKPCSPKSAQ